LSRYRLPTLSSSTPAHVPAAATVSGDGAQEASETGGGHNVDNASRCGEVGIGTAARSSGRPATVRAEPPAPDCLHRRWVKKPSAPVTRMDGAATAAQFLCKRVAPAVRSRPSISARSNLIPIEILDYYLPGLHLIGRARVAFPKSQPGIRRIKPYLIIVNTSIGPRHPGERCDDNIGARGR
jgi:hypothetical protein